MKCTATPEQMEQRRRERLRRLAFFMSRREIPTFLGRDECLNLLTGWFLNSKWAVCRFVFRRALEESWEYFKLDAQLFWHYRVCRRSREETERRVFGADPDEEEEETEDEWPEEVGL